MSGPDEREVKKLLGEDVVDCLLEALGRGDLGPQQAEDLAFQLHDTAGGQSETCQRTYELQLRQTNYASSLV